VSQPFSPNNVEAYYDDDTMLPVANKVDDYTDHQKSPKESLQSSSSSCTLHTTTTLLLQDTSVREKLGRGEKERERERKRETQK
jgi:hypothetical protein